MHIITVVLFCIAPSAFGWYDFTGKNQRWTIRSLGNELMADIKLKVRQTIDIRKEHGRYISYEVGFIIGQIREKYKLMMELYRICYDRVQNYINFQTPKIEDYKTAYYFKKQELVHFLAMDIDKLIEVLERTNLPVTPFPSDLEGHILRAGIASDEDIEDEKQKQLEEAVKRRYREQYLMKKLNSPGQSTTKKRFMNKWPVEGTWSLETY